MPKKELLNFRYLILNTFRRDVPWTQNLDIDHLDYCDICEKFLIAAETKVVIGSLEKRSSRRTQILGKQLRIPSFVLYYYPDLQTGDVTKVEVYSAGTPRDQQWKKTLTGEEYHQWLVDIHFSHYEAEHPFAVAVFKRLLAKPRETNRWTFEKGILAMMREANFNKIVWITPEIEKEIERQKDIETFG